MTVSFRAEIDDTAGSATPYASAFNTINAADVGDVVNIRVVGDANDTPLNEDDGTPITYFLKLTCTNHDPLVSPVFTPNSDFTWQWDNVVVPGDVERLSIFQGSPDDESPTEVAFDD